MRRTKKS